MSPTKWKRPDSVAFPTVWAQCIGKKGLKYRVQDVTPDMHVDIIDHMVNNFLHDEEMCKTLRLVEEEDSVISNIDMWRKMLQDNVALVAIAEDDGRIVGVNVTAISTKEEHLTVDEFSGVQMKKIARLMLEYLPSKMDVFAHYGVDRYLTAMGLSVLPECRGQGIGEALLRAREPLCRALGIPATSTVFTGIASQIPAQRCGFQLLYELPYDSYTVDGDVVFKGMKTKTLKVMGIKF